MKLMKTLFVWLLLLAVPLQGHAAATLNFCASSSAATARNAAHCHVAGITHAASQDVQDVAKKKAVAGAVCDKCSHCTSCTSGALSMPAFAASLSFEPPAAEPIAYLPLYSSNPQYDGLERPPHRRPA